MPVIFNSTSHLKNSAASDRKRSERKRQYIIAAEKIIREEGVCALSIRRIAAEMKCNSATLYNYFQDIDELTLHATFRFRKDYLEAVAREVTADLDPLQQYIKLNEVYCRFAFDQPELYYNMYFGKYSRMLDEVRKDYYTLFPEEMIPQVPLVEEMLAAQNVYQGDESICRRIAEAGFLRKDSIRQVANLIVRTHSSYMHDLMTFSHLEPDTLRQEFMDCLLDIIDHYSH